MAFLYTDDQRSEYFAKKNLRYKRIEKSDLQIVDNLYRVVQFDVGYHNLKLYYETSPDGWSMVLDENGQAIIAEGCNFMTNGILYAYAITCHENWRGQKLTSILSPDFLTSPTMSSSTEYSILRHMTSKHWLEKRCGFSGFCTRKVSCDKIVAHIPGIRIEKLRAEYIHQLLEYDQRISLIDRSDFVREWSMPNDPIYGETVIAINELDGKCLGYGTMRLFSDYQGIQPLYAESDEIANALMTALVKWCLHDDVYLYFPALATKKVVFDFCYNMGMMITDTEMRNCSASALSYAKSLPVKNVYSMHEYYPI